MTIVGDPDEIRDEARRLRHVAESTESQALTVRRGEGVHWHGRAGDRYRERLAEYSAAIATAAHETRDASRHIDELAAALEERQAAIRRAMHIVGDLVDSARRTVNALAGQAREALSDAERAAHDQAQRLLDRASHAPAPGDPAWLDLAGRLGR